MTSNTNIDTVVRYFDSIDHLIAAGVISSVTGQTFKEIVGEFEIGIEDFDDCYHPEQDVTNLDVFLDYAPLLTVVSSGKLPYSETFAGVPVHGGGDETYYAGTLKMHLKHFIAEKLDITMKLFKMLCLISAHRHGSRSIVMKSSRGLAAELTTILMIARRLEFEDRPHHRLYGAAMLSGLIHPLKQAADLTDKDIKAGIVNCLKRDLTGEYRDFLDALLRS